MIGAAAQHVAAVHRHDVGRELHQLRHPVFHVVRDVVVAQVTVVPELHPQIVRLRDLVRRGDARAQRAEGVEGLAHPTAGAPRPPALGARRDVDHARVAEDGAPPVLLAHVLGRPLEDDAQLRLVLEHVRARVVGQHHRVAVADDGVRRLEEHVELPRFSLLVLPVVADAVEHLARARQRRAQPHFGERRRCAVGQYLLQGRPQRLEAVDERFHLLLRCRRGQCRDGRHDVDDTVIPEQSYVGRLVGCVTQVLVPDDLHVTSPSGMSRRHGSRAPHDGQPHIPP